jgi:hypothetical protein
MCSFDHALDVNWIILFSGMVVMFMALRFRLDWSQVGPLVSYALLLMAGAQAYAGLLVMTGFIISTVCQSPDRGDVQSHRVGMTVQCQPDEHLHAARQGYPLQHLRKCNAIR